MFIANFLADLLLEKRLREYRRRNGTDVGLYNPEIQAAVVRCKNVPLLFWDPPAYKPLLLGADQCVADSVVCKTKGGIPYGLITEGPFSGVIVSPINDESREALRRQPLQAENIVRKNGMCIERAIDTRQLDRKTLSAKNGKPYGITLFCDGSDSQHDADVVLRLGQWRAESYQQYIDSLKTPVQSMVVIAQLLRELKLSSQSSLDYVCSEIVS